MKKRDNSAGHLTYRYTPIEEIKHVVLTLPEIRYSDRHGQTAERVRMLTMIFELRYALFESLLNYRLSCLLRSFDCSQWIAL